MNSEPIPDFGSDLLAEGVSQGFSAVDVEVIHHQMDGAGVGIGERQLRNHHGELQTRAIRRCKGEVVSGQRLYGAENVGSPTAFVLTVATSFPARFRQRDRPDLGV